MSILPLASGVSARDRVAPEWGDVVQRWYPRLRHVNAQPAAAGPVAVGTLADNTDQNVRLDFGRYAADWLKQAGSGPIHLSDLSGGGASAPMWSDDVPVWWANPAFMAGIDGFRTKLAALVDGKWPALVWSYPMTGYAEPFILQAGGETPEAIANRKAFEAKGFEQEANRNVWFRLIDLHFGAFHRTRTIISFNPGQTRRGTTWDATDIDWTFEVMDYVCTRYPHRVILYNCSLNRRRYEDVTAMRQMYDRMAWWHDAGIPIGFQTSIGKYIHDDLRDSLETTLGIAADLGAHIVELPTDGDYAYWHLISKDKLAAADARLRANR